MLKRRHRFWFIGAFLILSIAVFICCGFYAWVTTSSFSISSESSGLKKVYRFREAKDSQKPVHLAAGGEVHRHDASHLSLNDNSKGLRDERNFDDHDIQRTKSHLNDLLDDVLLQSIKPTEGEGSGARTHSKKRSQEYCNVLEHSAFDNRQNIPPIYNLSAVALIIRHGDRTPIYTLPNHKLPQQLSCNLIDVAGEQSLGFISLIKSQMNEQNKSFPTSIQWLNSYPNGLACAAGQLTSRGFLQMIDLGKLFRRTYIDGENLTPGASSLSSEVYIRATEVTRAFQSAVGFLYGFLSEDEFRKVRIEFDQDVYFCANSIKNFTCNCPAAKRLQTIMKQELFEDHDRIMERHIKEKLAVVFNTSTGQIPWLGAVVEVLMSHVCHGLSLPCRHNGLAKSDCVTWSLINKMWHFIDRSGLRHLNSTALERYSRLTSFPLLHEIVHRFLNVKNYSTREKSVRFHFFSGHDKTISTVTKALGIHDGLWPPYASHLVFELYDQRKKQYYLRVLYNGKDVTRQVRFCQEVGSSTHGLCPFENFVYFVFYETCHYFKVADYEQMCNS